MKNINIGLRSSLFDDGKCTSALSRPCSNNFLINPGSIQQRFAIANIV